MSDPERPPDPAVPTTKLKRKHLTDEDQAELFKLDSAFKRIKSAVPQTPYILSTPSLYPYQYHSRHEAQAWMMGRLFQPDEEALQYRTFLFREPYQDCFTLQNGEEYKPEPPPPKPEETPKASSQGPKKKISLSAYKSKQANGVITPGSKKVSPTLPPTKAPRVQANGVKPPEKQPPALRKPDPGKPQKRSAPEPRLPEKPDKRPRHDRPPPAPAPLKNDPAEPKSRVDKSDPSNSTPHGLPPLLSPVDQPLSNPYGLPPILSPTLPLAITEELKRIETRNRSDSNTSASSSDRKSQLLSVPEPGSQKHSVAGKTISRERSVSTSGKSPAKSPVPAPRPTNDDEDGEGDAESLVVKLRYTKKTRDTIKQLLKLPPKREGLADKKKEREDTPKEPPALAQKKLPADVAATKLKPISKAPARRLESSKAPAPAPAPKAVEKRPRAEEDGTQPTASKRPRANTLQDGPNTPKDQTFTSLANKSTKPSAQKIQQTPRKDHKAINMLRGSSADGHDPTPGRGNTPSIKQDARASTSSPLNNTKKQVDLSALHQASMKLNAMGRTLKYDSKKYEDERGGKKDDRKRAAVISLECVLTYMSAFHTQDLVCHLRGRRAEVEHSWKMLLDLCASYARLTKDFQHLDGFRSYLAAAISSHICTLLTPRVPNPNAHDSPQELPHAELAKQHSMLSENFSMFTDNYMHLLRHMQDARIALPMDDMQKLFPKTWAGAEPNAKLAKIPEKPNGAKLSGPYFLPIANDTTPIQAVRFGIKFLHEYCDRERMDHNMRINLDRVE